VLPIAFTTIELLGLVSVCFNSTAMKKVNINLGRRSFLANTTKIGVLHALNLFPYFTSAQKDVEASAGTTTEHVFLTQPYLQDPSPNSMCIMWITNKPCYSWVEYGENRELRNKVQADKEGLVTANNKINQITLEGLSPATDYWYRVVSQEIFYSLTHPWKVSYGEIIYSDVYSFTTPELKPKEVSWLIMNDIHDRPFTIPHLLALNGNDSYDFVFFNGDIFDHQMDEQQIIDHLLQPCSAAFAKGKPFMMVRGNHETRGPFTRQLRHYFANKGRSYYYAFEWGPVFVIVLDTGEDKEDIHEQYAGLANFDRYRREQAEWAEKVMQTQAFKKAKFRVVLMHIPHFYSGDRHGTMHCRELFAPLFNKYKIDVTISGHTHKYGVFDPSPGQHNYPIIIGGGPIEGNRTLIKVKAGPESLKITMLRDDGTEVGKYII
jgi:acid phosphatase type 7